MASNVDSLKGVTLPSIYTDKLAAAKAWVEADETLTNRHDPTTIDNHADEENIKIVNEGDK